MFANLGNVDNGGQVYVHGDFSNQGIWDNLSTGMVYECAPELKIVSDLISFSFDLKALTEMQQSVTGDLTIAVKPLDVSTLSAQAQLVIGSRPVFDFALVRGGTEISSFGAGVFSVWMPYTLAAGEIAQDVRAVYADGGKAVYLPDSRYDTSAKAVVFSTNHLSIYGVGYDESTWSNPFTDVPEQAWYLADVRYVVRRGLFSGTSATTFSPEDGMSRSMLWTVLARMDGQAVSGGESWYAPAADWVMAEGISDGTNPDGSLTREQLAVILYRYAGSPKTVADLAPFHDAAQASTWAAEAMQWAVARGVLLGDGGKLAPQATATRAEAAAILSRAAVLLK